MATSPFAIRCAGAALALACAAGLASAQPGESEALAARFAAPATRLETPGLQPGRTSFTTQAELAALLQSLAAMPGGPQLLDLGRSQAGEPLQALRFARGGGDRPRVLLVGQQHGDEPAGCEALLVLAQELAAGRHDALLDRVDVLLLPRANPDGAASGQRRTADGVDLNRDHLLLRTPEARAVARLLRRFDPVLVVDLHEHAVPEYLLRKFGALPRADLLLQFASVPNLPPAVAEASEAWFRQPLLRALDEAGLRSDWYHTNPPTPGDLRLSMGGPQPDTLRNLQGLRGGVGVLLESRGADAGRLHLQRRVQSQRVAALSLLRSAAAHATEFAAWRQGVQSGVADATCRGEVVVLAALTPTRREMLMLDPITGADVPRTVAWQSALSLRPLIERPRPCGYWLAPAAGDAVERLQLLGLHVERLAAPRVLPAEAWREVSRFENVAGDAAARLLQVRTEALALHAPAGSALVSLRQPLALAAVAALEPDAPTSWFAQRVLPTLDSAARVMVPWDVPVGGGAAPAPPPASAASAP